MKISLIKAVLLVSLCIPFQSCKEQAKKPEKIAKEQNDANLKNQPKERDYSELLVKVTHDQLYEVELGKIGIANTKNEKIKDFAEKLQTHHEARIEKIATLAAELQYALPSNLSDKQWNEINKLKNHKAKDFDKEWIKEVISKHNSAVNTLVEGIENTTNSKIKGQLNETLQEVRSHLETAIELQNNYIAK